MKLHRIGMLALILLLAAAPVAVLGKTKTQNAKGDRVPHGTYFHTSERCVACHNGMKSTTGEEFNIGFDWSASIMANSSRDPYWQASIRRETLDHPESSQHVQDDCSTCHMPAVRMPERDRGLHTNVFSKFPLDRFPKGDKAAADGVTCSVCHQVDKGDLGTEASFSGNVKFSRPIDEYHRAEWGPYVPDTGHQTVMHSSTATFVPMQGLHMRDAALCGSCHTLYTEALGPDGKTIGRLPEQMPYQEWQHSAYNNTAQTCQYCHMPEVKGQVPVTALYGPLRDNARHHVFLGGNFIIEGMLQDHRDELATFAYPAVVDAQIKGTSAFVQTQSAKLTVSPIQSTSNGIAVDVHVENLGGHKLPTAYPSRRVWLHVLVRDAVGTVIFESGKLNPDGSIAGNLNDEDKSKFSPHYREITSPSQVEIYEDILKDQQGHVTTGLLQAVGYLKDNRILPRGFDKTTASNDIAVIGNARNDPGFNDQGSTVRYAISTANAAVPFTVQAELWFQPIGFRWAHNLAPYNAPEPQRMVRYFEQAANKSAILLAAAHAGS